MGIIGNPRLLEAMQFSANVFIPNFTARAPFEGIGWMLIFIWQYCCDNWTKDTNGVNQINLPSTYATQVYYLVYLQNIDWMVSVNNNEIVRIVRQGLRIEGFQILR